jgi:hypothetical protein
MEYPMLVHALAAGLMIAAPVSAQNASAKASVSGPDATDKVICRRPQPELGSRMTPKRVCKPASVWDAEAKTAQEVWDRRQQPPSGDPGS